MEKLERMERSDIDYRGRTCLVHVVVGEEEDGHLLQWFDVVVGHLMPELEVPEEVWDLKMK